MKNLVLSAAVALLFILAIFLAGSVLVHYANELFAEQAQRNELEERLAAKEKLVRETYGPDGKSPDPAKVGKLGEAFKRVDGR